MKPVKELYYNDVLKAPKDSENVDDLPIARIKFNDGQQAVESCWELTDEELQEVLKSKKVYFTCMGKTHPPIILSTKTLIK